MILAILKYHHNLIWEAQVNNLEDFNWNHLMVIE